MLKVSHMLAIIIQLFKIEELCEKALADLKCVLMANNQLTSVAKFGIGL